MLVIEQPSHVDAQEWEERICREKERIGGMLIEADMADALNDLLSHERGSTEMMKGHGAENGEWVLGELVAGTIVALPQLTPEAALSLPSSGPLGFAGVEE